MSASSTCSPPRSNTPNASRLSPTSTTCPAGETTSFDSGICAISARVRPFAAGNSDAAGAGRDSPSPELPHPARSALPTAMAATQASSGEIRALIARHATDPTASEPYVQVPHPFPPTPDERGEGLAFGVELDAHRPVVQHLVMVRAEDDDVVLYVEVG